MSEPTVRRKFVLFDPTDNHNKVWTVEWWADTGQAKTIWGRIDVSQQSKSFNGWTMGMVEGKISEKIHKGYTEVSLHVPTAAPTQAMTSTVTDKRVADLLDLIFREAGEHIKSYMAVGVDALSKDQIAKGKAVLGRLIAHNQVTNPSLAERVAMADLVKEFYNTIPTQLPSRIDQSAWDWLVGRFLADLHEQEDRLDQLEAGLAAYQAAATGQTDYMAQLGDVELKVMEQNTTAYGQIADYILRTSGGRYHLSGLFAVNIRPERDAFDVDTVGRHRIASLFHGTRSQNIRHILRSGLIIPKVAANGRRCGNGIYFSDHSQRSYGYTGGRSNSRFLLVADVAIGTPYKVPDTYQGNNPPNGYDSVHGTNNWGKNGDEFVVFRSVQQTIRAIALVE